MIDHLVVLKDFLKIMDTDDDAIPTETNNEEQIMSDTSVPPTGHERDKGRMQNLRVEENEAMSMQLPAIENEITADQESFEKSQKPREPKRNVDAPTSVDLLRLLQQEKEIATITITRENVVSLAERHVVCRSVHQHNLMRSSLTVASNCIDSKRMLDHLEKIAKDIERNHERSKKSDMKELRAKIAEYRQVLDTAILEYDQAEINDIQGVLEAMMLNFDAAFLEQIEIRKLSFKQAVSDNTPPEASPSWYQNPVYRLLSLLKGDFCGDKSLVTPEEQRWYISRGAWAIAIISMFVAIGFVISEFSESKRHPALSTNVIRHERLQLPLVYACLTIPFIPMFEDFPKGKYVGRPIWGLRSYSNSELNESIMFPETKKKISESVILGPKDVCKKEMQYMSKPSIDQVSEPDQHNLQCYSCLRIGRKRQDILEYKKAFTRASGAVTLEFSVLRDLDFCFVPFSGKDGFLRRLVREQLLKYKEKFVEQKVVELSNNVSIYGMEYALQFGFEGYENEKLQKIAAEATVFCNLYLFSGVFYPAKPGTETRYNFNVTRGREAWKPIGNPEHYVKVRPVHPADLLGNVSGSTVMDELHMRGPLFETAQSTYHLSLQVYSVSNISNGQPSFKDFSASLRNSRKDLLLYTKTIEQGNIQYSSAFHFGPQKIFLAFNRFRRFIVSLDFATFDIEVSEKVPTTTLAEFLTDIFEYVGLFTGVCAYSVLVSPARMYLRRLQRIEHD